MSPEQLSVLVLIPAFNEEATIGSTVRAVKTLGQVSRVLVVDDGSGDETWMEARRAGAEVIRQPHNQGKGAALNRGLTEFRESILLLVDGDLGESAKEVEKLLQPIIDGKADMAIARFPRCTGLPSGFGLVKGLAVLGIKILGGLKVEAPLSGQRALTRSVVEKVGRFADGFGVEVDLTVRSARQGFRVVEVDTQLEHLGATGRDWPGFRHRGRQFWHVARALARSRR